MLSSVFLCRTSRYAPESYIKIVVRNLFMFYFSLDLLPQWCLTVNCLVKGANLKVDVSIVLAYRKYVD